MQNYNERILYQVTAGLTIVVWNVASFIYLLRPHMYLLTENSLYVVCIDTCNKI
jgi:hypothetical protein